VKKLLLEWYSNDKSDSTFGKAKIVSDFGARNEEVKLESGQPRKKFRETAKNEPVCFIFYAFSTQTSLVLKQGT
jgi:hypothetical protein